jgi:hypothetical protein
VVKILKQKLANGGSEDGKLIESEDFFLVYTLFNLLSKCDQGGKTLIKLVKKYIEKMTQISVKSINGENFYDENGQISQSDFYNKEKMG